MFHVVLSRVLNLPMAAVAPTAIRRGCLRKAIEGNDLFAVMVARSQGSVQMQRWVLAINRCFFAPCIRWRCALYQAGGKSIFLVCIATESWQLALCQPPSNASLERWSALRKEYR